MKTPRSMLPLVLALVGAVAGCDSPDATTAACTNGTLQLCQTFCGSQGTATCANGQFGQCVPPQEVANGLDDNCNGQVDEGLTPRTDPTTNPAEEDCLTPGQLEGCITTCTSIGQRTCNALKKWGACVPPIEDCNNQDDDCNGKVDENLQRNCQSVCGLGTEVCANGVWQNCTAPEAQVEGCDGLDNDCDGKTDLAANGTALVQTCNEGCGFGSQTCQNAGWTPCSTQPAAEKCDGLDNDCNGKIDDAPGGCNCKEGETKSCGETTGECNPGSQQCISGTWTQCGGNNYKAEGEEKCNGLDDDCDGITDEGNPEGGTACGTPNNTQGGPPNLVLPCTIGQMSCLNGQLQCVGGVDPGPEVCDGKDNDCDGVVDDNPQGDQWETNQSCQTLTDLGFVVENQGTSFIQANLYPGSDVDWYRVTAKESANFCFGGEEGPYTFSVTLKPPSTLSGASASLDYDLCVYPMDSTSCSSLPAYGLCDGSNGSQDLGIWKLKGEPETFTSASWMGECFGNDDRAFIIQVVTYNPQTDFSCDPYTLEFQHSGN